MQLRVILSLAMTLGAAVASRGYHHHGPDAAGLYARDADADADTWSNEDSRFHARGLGAYGSERVLQGDYAAQGLSHHPHSGDYQHGLRDDVSLHNHRGHHNKKSRHCRICDQPCDQFDWCKDHGPCF